MTHFKGENFCSFISSIKALIMYIKFSYERSENYCVEYGMYVNTKVFMYLLSDMQL